MTRELRVARHLIENAAPVVGPCAELPAGPHVEQGFVLTLWKFVEHTAADGDNVEHVARAAAALHRALVGFRGELPDLFLKCWRLKMNRCGMIALTTIALASPALAASGDASRGQQDFRACAPCHSLERDRNKTGPCLANLWGRKAGSLPSFERYSDAVKSSGIIWAIAHSTLG